MEELSDAGSTPAASTNEKESRKPLSLRDSFCFQAFCGFFTMHKYVRYAHICAFGVRFKTTFCRRICRRGQSLPLTMPQ